MQLTLLDSPRPKSPVGRDYRRDLHDSTVLGTYPDEPSALAAIRQLGGSVARDRLVLTYATSGIVAEGRLLSTWAGLDRRPDGGVPRVRRHKEGDRLLCGWCGGTVARMFPDRIAPVEALMWASPSKRRHGLPTLHVRSSPHRNRYRQTLAGYFSAAEMEVRPGRSAPVVAVECPLCAPKAGQPAVSLLVPRLDFRLPVD